MLGQFTRKQKPDGGLDFTGANNTPLVIIHQSTNLGNNSLEDIIHKTIHDGHNFKRDAGVWVDLLEDFIDVDGEGLLPLCSSGLLLVGWCGFGRLLVTRVYALFATH